MEFLLGYGSGKQKLTVPDKNIIGVLTPNETEAPASEQGEIIRALSEPIGSKRLRDIVRPGEKVSIVTSDITRPMPTYKVMPALLDELYAGGARPEDITLVFALGSHRKHTEAEKRHLAGERAFAEINLEDSDVDDCVHIGFTSRGTPVDITRTVAEADRRILLGNIEFHYFAGYSGGAKAIMPGVSTPAAIEKNHSLMVMEESRAGNLETNPLRQDIEEAGAMLGADFILNVVLNERKEIVAAFAGDMVKAHREGVGFLDRLFSSPIKEQADIVVTCQAGAPKDLNLYQTQKALDNAKHAVKDGGTVILVGACEEGLGNDTFARWMTEAESPEAIIERLSRGFKLGGHKAAAIALVRRRADIILVSEMDGELVRSIFLEPERSVQRAFDRALERHGANASVIIMPYGGSTLPKLV